MDIDGFKEGYLLKSAAEGSGIGPGIGTGLGIGAAQAGLGTAAFGIKKGTALALVLPILLGIGAGSSMSKLTSPSGVDSENLQKSLVAAELDEAIAELKRKKAFANQSEEPRNSPREIRF